MNDFDFSDYDYEEPIITQKKVTKVKPKKEEEEDFDFNDYDYGEELEFEPLIKPEIREEKEKKNPYEAREISAEELKKMSIPEKMEYAKELNREKEYLRSKAFLQNAASELSLGAYQPEQGEEGEEDFGGGGLTGRFIGSAPSMIASFGVAGLGTKAAFKNAPKILKPLERFLQAFGAGAIHGAAKQGVAGALGREVDLTEIPIEGAEVAAIDALLRGLGSLGRKFFDLTPKQQSSLLEKRIIPEDLPKSQYETAEKMLKVINEGRGPPPPPPGGGPPPPPAAPSSRIEPSRITPARDIGLRPETTPNTPREALQDRVGDIFSS